MKTDAALWQALTAYDLDTADAEFPFSRRLARDNGWTQDFACRAIAEYKRFIYLVCVSGNTLTPSEEIDSVWHLHLIYTQDYWDRLCGETLGLRIHHSPTKGGHAETGKYLTGYRRTLEFYLEEFGDAPPQEFWPEAAKRFASGTTRHIDTKTHMILPKRQVFLCLVMAAPLALASCSILGDRSPVLPWTIFALFALALIITNFTAIVRAGLPGFVILTTALTIAGAWLFGKEIAQILARATGLPVTTDMGAAAVAALILGFYTWMHVTPKTSGSDCGSGCGNSDSGSGCGSGCGGGD